jgi:hypothetical protein
LDPPLWRDLGLIHRATTLSPAARAFIEIAGHQPPSPKSRG